ncbi:pirin family protein [Pantoea agglomerans]|jgi:redox-sensitive bicupin YhaK (pirin superfamily)|uniref:pirin family protein n=1 Tax=Pantoea TaxID=53335 RepID=UPI0005E2B41A|nr:MULTISPECIES: pirin family protein [Pantoea]KJH61177.1 pirin [Pantoea agglomerans]MBD8197538.1 pirin family protein [Pantoea agglomerans]MCW0973617.1 pirin family protein [Pantoea sp. JV6]MDQ0631908.1 redox-sensitive bicupin YhaK (pirin superfamily) [Pantoea agglomerans]MDY0997801.1 pirin family protein [Pantoea agglomerans]
MNIVRANPEQLFEYGPFTVRRQRPGEALSPLVSVDLMSLKLDARIPMQQHQDEEVFTYLWRGSMQHQDSNGERTQLSAKRVMVVNAGDGVQYEESVPLYEAELLQAVIRPSQQGGEAMTQVLERDQGIMTNGWTELAGPEESDAPLELRQEVYIFDTLLERNHTLDVPSMPGFVAYLTVLEGIIRVGDQRLSRGDAVSGLDSSVEIVGDRDANLVCFLIKPDNFA